MHFDKPTYTVRKVRKKDIPKGLYTKDPSSGDILFNKELEDNQMVSPKSGHHFPLGARARIANLLDPDTFLRVTPPSARVTPSSSSTPSLTRKGSGATRRRVD